MQVIKIKINRKLKIIKNNDWNYSNQKNKMKY